MNLEILRLGSNGEGVARYQEPGVRSQVSGVRDQVSGGLTVFVPGALPGEKVAARITLRKKNYAVAELQQVIEASQDRVEPPCFLYKQCGGCQLQHYAYAAQLKMKQQQVQDALERIGHLACQALPTLGMQEPWYYRNKMQFPVQNTAGKLEIGCYALKTHGVINTNQCLIQEEGNNQVLRAVRSWMEQYHIPAYDEKAGRGLVRHVMGRTGVRNQGSGVRVQDSGGRGQEVLAVIVCTSLKIPHQEDLVRMLREQVPGLVGVVVNLNTKKTNIIMGRQCQCIWGREYLFDHLGALQFRVSPLSFFQVNRSQAQMLYEKVLEFALLKGKERVVDVYCGTGTISLFLAQKAGQVYGIEIVEAAIRDAQENARDNHITNAEFIVGDAAAELPKLLQSGFKPDVVVVDPPRAGCDEKVLQAILEVEPERIVYVSCNPATLARDLALLQRKYAVEIVQPVDMFPQTTHIETVVKLARKKQ